LPPPNSQPKATTQDHLDIQEIVDGLVLLKNGGCCLVLQTTTINFGLLAEIEQDAIIYAYAGFLNSLTFPIQILIRSQKKDVTGYIKSLAKREELIKNPQLKQRIVTYRRFVEYIVRANQVLDKKFYLIIPFSPLEAGISGGGLLAKPKSFSVKDRAWLLEKARNALVPKRDHLIRQLSRIGLKVKQLDTQELIKLFFSIYNSEAVGQILATPEDYQSLAVQPGINNNNLTDNQSVADSDHD
jgi:hypothetical protein